MTVFLLTQEKNKKADWLDYQSQAIGTIEAMVKRMAEFEKNCKVVFGSTGPNFLLPQLSPRAMNVPYSADVDPALSLNASTINDDILGYRYFLCVKCLQAEVVPFHLTADPIIRGGLSIHRCEAMDGQHEIGKTVQFDNKKVEEFISAVRVWTGRNPYLYAVKAEPTSIQEYMNHKNFGERDENHYLCDVVKNGVIKIDSVYQLRDFLVKALATYCLCEFTHSGKREMYFIFVSRPPRNFC